MKFEQTIRTLSAVLAGVLMYFFAGALYLGAKGFAVDENGNFVLMNQATAQEISEPKEISANYAFPQDHALGSDKAPVTLYEYSSFGCSHCADFHLDVLPQLKEAYIDKGLVRVVFVPLPLDKNSMDAALLAECVAPEKYFDFADVLFKKQRDWGMAFQPQKVLLQYAALSGVGDEKAQTCLRDDIVAARILKDRQTGLADLGIAGTPSFVISSASGNQLVSGLKSVAEFKMLLDNALPEKEESEQPK